MAKRRPDIVVEERGAAAVAWAIGTTHRFYEDRFRLLPREVPVVERHFPARGEVFAVFDGIGGAPEGMRAAQAMADALVDFYRSPDVFAPTWQGLLQVLLGANETIYGWGFIEGTDRPLGGCAGTVAWITGADLYLFHAGDTEGFLLTSTGHERLTRIHEAQQGIYRYFGRGPGLEVDVAHRPVQGGEWVLLVSDGVTKVFDQAQMVAIVQDGADPADAARKLAQKAQAKGSPDDITVLVAEIDLE